MLPVGSDEFVEKCGDSCKKEPEKEEFLENILWALNEKDQNKLLRSKQVFNYKWTISPACGEGGVPDERECVVEDVGRVCPRVARINHIGTIGLSQLHLHKLGRVLFNSPLATITLQKGICTFRVQTCLEWNWIRIKAHWAQSEWG